MRIGILGSGLMGGKLGTIFAHARHEVVFSYARSQEKLKRLSQDAPNAQASTPAGAAAEADVLLLAVHWSRIADMLKQTGDLSNKVIVTCSLPLNDDNSKLVVAHASSGAEELAKMIPKARVVSAFNTIPSEVLFGVFEARHKAPRPNLVYCGDDSSSKRIAFELNHHAARSSLGPHGLQWGSLCGDRSSAHAGANHIQTRVRGLVVSRSAAFGVVRNTRAVGICGSFPYARGPVWRWSCRAAVALHRNSQRLGQHRLPRVCRQTRYRQKGALRRDFKKGHALAQGVKYKEQKMDIKRSGTQPSGKGPAEYFTGSVRIDPLFQTNDPARALGASVTFEPGARTAWLTHPLGQTLIVTAGCGWVQRWGGSIEEIGPGDVVWIPPGEQHWHGATAPTAMTHIAIAEHLDRKTADWMEQVSDEQYRR